MTTKELEKKLKISSYTCIHCQTLELAKQVLSIFDQLRLKWCTGRNYMICNNWSVYKENTVYYPFDGEVSPLKYAKEEGYKIISAEEFIALHTEEFDLENYEPKGDLIGFPKEVIARMLECQEEQGNKRNVSIFENNRRASICYNGFDWDKTKENIEFWGEVIIKKDFDLFFKKYPKQDNQDNLQEFNLENYEPKGELIGFPKEIIARMLDCQEEQGNKRDISVFEKNRNATMYSGGFDWNLSKEGLDFWAEVILIPKNFNLFFEKYPKKEIKVINIILNLKGETPNIKSNCNLEVNFEGESCLTEHFKTLKRTCLLHYRDDCNDDVTDSNNLPKRQEPKRWRAEEGGCYHFVSFDERCWFYSNGAKDDYASCDNNNYNSGNYFRTEVEAEIIAQKLNSYFKQLIKEEHDTHRN